MFIKIIYYPSQFERKERAITKPGGLDCREQSRSRSRFLDLSRSTFESVEIFSTHRDVLFQTVEIEISIKTLTKIEIYRDFRVIETVEPWILNCREYLNSRDVVFQTVKNFSTVETWFFQMSRSRVSIEITSRQIETPRLTDYFIITIIIP
jgi:hypothetical protein